MHTSVYKKSWAEFRVPRFDPQMPRHVYASL